MRMKAEFMGALEVIGEISKLERNDEWLVMNVRTTTPVGWNLRAAFTHKDLLTMIKLIIKPSNLRYIIFGFGKPRDPNKPPEY
jgi:hypothetical protein